VSPDFISAVTDEVMAEALAWQSRVLEQMYPMVFFDALLVKTRSHFPNDEAAIKLLWLALRNVLIGRCARPATG
jgi:transposase-like protein